MPDPLLAENVLLNSRFVTVHGVPLYTRLVVDAPARLRQPDARPLVLVHGLSMSSRYMERLARQLAPDHTVFALDLPGFGSSAKFQRMLTLPELATIVAGWMDALDLPRASFIAHSFGCQLTLELACKEPARVGRSVLIAPTADPRAGGVVEHALRTLLDMLREPPLLTPVAIASFLSMGMGRGLNGARELARDAVESKLPRVQSPMLVLRGARDPIVSQRWVEEVTAQLPRAQLHVIADHAHAVHFSAPGKVAALVREFLD